MYLKKIKACIFFQEMQSSFHTLVIEKDEN